jgi:hypothetical protein
MGYVIFELRKASLKETVLLIVVMRCLILYSSLLTKLGLKKRCEFGFVNNNMPQYFQDLSFLPGFFVV